MNPQTAKDLTEPSKDNCARDLFFGTDYHTHLGTEVGGLALLDGDIEIISRDISNSQFKSKFGKHYRKMKGKLGIGVISDIKEEQPIKSPRRKQPQLHKNTLFSDTKRRSSIQIA